MTRAGGSDPSDNAGQIAYWNDKAAITWTAFQERIDAAFEVLTDHALAAAAPRRGERVIDVGCGCGATVLALARAVGADGHVLGVDVSDSMAARARERIGEAGLPHAEVALADAATHVFAKDETDLVFSRFGVMFFADPTAAFANLATATKPGGRLVFAAWRPLADNGWMSVPLEAARSLLPAQPPADPNAPGPFAFADRDRVRRILAAAGWRTIDAVRQDAPMRIAGVGQRDEATEMATRVGPLARALAGVDLGPDLRGRVREVVSRALRDYESPDGIVLPGSVWIVSAQR